MNKTLVLLATLGSVVVLGTAAAHTPNANSNCAEHVMVDEATLTVTDLYVDVTLDGGTLVWQESNDIAGLQTHEHTCRILTYDANGKRTCGTGQTPACEIVVFAADTPVL